jgi:hypothetical protein
VLVNAGIVSCNLQIATPFDHSTVKDEQLLVKDFFAISNQALPLWRKCNQHPLVRIHQ